MLHLRTQLKGALRRQREPRPYATSRAPQAGSTVHSASNERRSSGPSRSPSRSTPTRAALNIDESHTTAHSRVIDAVGAMPISQTLPRRRPRGVAPSATVAELVRERSRHRRSELRQNSSAWNAPTRTGRSARPAASSSIARLTTRIDGFVRSTGATSGSASRRAANRDSLGARRASAPAAEALRLDRRRRRGTAGPRGGPRRPRGCSDGDRSRGDVGPGSRTAVPTLAASAPICPCGERALRCRSRPRRDPPRELYGL